MIGTAVKGRPEENAEGDEEMFPVMTGEGEEGQRRELLRGRGTNRTEGSESHYREG